MRRRPGSTVTRDESGTATAEYAVGTVAAACVGCVLIQLTQGDGSFFWDFLTGFYERLTSVVPYLAGFPDSQRPWLMI